MSERGSGKSRKSLASKASAPKASMSETPAPKARASKAPAPAKAASKAVKTSADVPAVAPRKAKASPKAESVLDAPSLMSRVIRLESERDRLEQELTKAQARIRALEEDRDQVVNRIDWVIDSLRNLLENER